MAAVTHPSRPVVAPCQGSYPRRLGARAEAGAVGPGQLADQLVAPRNPALAPVVGGLRQQLEQRQPVGLEQLLAGLQAVTDLG